MINNLLGKKAFARGIILCAAMVLISLAATSASGQVSYEDIVALQKQAQIQGWTFDIGLTEAAQYSLDELCGLKAPDDWYKDAPFDACAPNKTLPEAYDWRDYGLPPVRNQGGCGSCWAFATVGPLECNIKIKDGILVNLSEQWLVSCNTEGWGCNGGWWAHQYHQWKKDPCYETGAVFEADFPYSASDLPCNCPYPHHYLIHNWAYIGSSYGIPAVDAMKQAIMDYGPISVAVVASSTMQSYRGGIFNHNATGDVNHGVVLVGWDDNQGTNGVWIMRNSWGTGWGEQGGYMRIEYGVSKIGYAACYINYPGALTITTESLPSCSLGVWYQQQMEANGGSGAITWFDRDGNLDGTGISLSPDGLLSGIPQVSAALNFVAAVEDNFDRYDERAFDIDVLKYMDGDANADAEINVADAVFMINYVFKGGPGPYPISLAGDANCDGDANIADAVYIINYVFMSGPMPDCQ